MKTQFLCLFVLLFCISCVSNVKPVCDVSPIPPLINIQSITDESSGELISPARLSDFYITDKAVNPNEAFTEKEFYRDISFLGIEFEEDSLLCMGSCKFGANAEEGAYQFDVSAEGYITKTINFDAKYEKTEDYGCGGVWTSLVKLDIGLEDNPLE